MMGDFTTDEITVVCSVFEYFTTKIKILQYPLTGESAQQVTAELIEEVKAVPWCKCVMTYATMRGMSMTDFCDGLKDLPENVQFFGGGAFNFDINSEYACVFSSADKISDHAVCFALMGGEDFNVTSTYITGWKPLGRELLVTNADGPKLLELDGKPAYEVYYKYLKIKNDEDFFNNTLEFPFFYEHNGINLLRAPVSSNRDGSLNMTADMEKNVKARIAYGDPWTILDATQDEASRLLPLVPECIFIFSCAGRRTFWGDNEAGKETLAYQEVAPTSGFYTSGEFLRTGKYLNQHNVTQVIAAMREGNPKLVERKTIGKPHKGFRGRVSIINRMATFIKATTEELEEANRKLQEANQKLSELAVMDTLTGVGNKNAYFEKVKQLEAGDDRQYAVAVFDLNGLKTINDNFGHEIGDQAIAKAAAALRTVFGTENVYRIGGDEFIALLFDRSEDDMRALFTRLEQEIAKQNEGSGEIPIGISKGFCVCAAGSGVEHKAVVSRADESMYADKAEYYRSHGLRAR
jgi:diguanylate cyclase (GGDEF)-like protein